MLQGLKSKKRHLILLSDVLNISNKSLTMALALSLSLYSGRRRKKLCGKNSVQQAMTMKFFFKKAIFIIGFLLHTRFDKSNSLTKDQGTFVTIFCSFSQLLQPLCISCSTFFAFRKGFGFSTTPYTPPSSIQKSLKLTLAWPENDNKDIIICLLVCKISLKQIYNIQRLEFLQQDKSFQKYT